MRLLPVSLLLAGCALGDTMTTPPPIGTPDAAQPEIGRFARGASAVDPGYGVVEDPTLDHVEVPRLWASMGDRICAFEGDLGQLQEDVWVDDAPSPVEIDVIDADGEGFLVLSPTQLIELDRQGARVRSYGMPYPVAAGERLDDGSIALLVVTGDGCALQVLGSARVPVHDGSCAALADLEEGPDGLYLATGDRTWFYDGAVVELDGADQITVDTATGSVFTGRTGEHALQADIGNSTIAIDLGGALVDVAARAGHAVALTETPELVRIDASTGVVVDRERYVGPMDRGRVLMGANGQSLLFTAHPATNGPREVQFYRVRTDLQMGLDE